MSWFKVRLRSFVSETLEILSGKEMWCLSLIQNHVLLQNIQVLGPRIHKPTEFWRLCRVALSPGLLTLCGVSLYIVYSYEALAEIERQVGAEGLAYIHTSFGWSLGMAWLSYILELLTGALLLVAAQTVKVQHSSPSMAWPRGSNTFRTGTGLYWAVRGCCCRVVL